MAPRDSPKSQPPVQFIYPDSVFTLFGQAALHAVRHLSTCLQGGRMEFPLTDPLIDDLQWVSQTFAPALHGVEGVPIGEFVRGILEWDVSYVNSFMAKGRSPAPCTAYLVPLSLVQQLEREAAVAHAQPAHAPQHPTPPLSHSNYTPGGELDQLLAWFGTATAQVNTVASGAPAAADWAAVEPQQPALASVLPWGTETTAAALGPEAALPVPGDLRSTSPSPIDEGFIFNCNADTQPLHQQHPCSMMF